MNQTKSKWIVEQRIVDHPKVPHIIGKWSLDRISLHLFGCSKVSVKLGVWSNAILGSWSNFILGCRLG